MSRLLDNLAVSERIAALEAELQNAHADANMLIGRNANLQAELAAAQARHIERDALDEQQAQASARIVAEALALRKLAEAIADGDGDAQEMARQTLAMLSPNAPDQARREASAGAPGSAGD